MNFIETLEKLLKEKNISAHKMSLDLGLSKSVVTAWRDRGNVPSGETLIKIADYFGVSVDYLLGREVPVAASINSPAGYESLSDAQREQIKSLIELFIAEQDKNVG